MITRRPICPQQVTDGGKALWDQHRDIEGRVEWDEAASFMREPYEQKARIVLETAIPQDPVTLRDFARECLAVADIL